MQKENTMTVGQWCGQWFIDNRPKWNGNTEGGYRNLIYGHILPNIGNVALSDLTEQTVTGFYDVLQSRGLSARSVWCVHLLLRRCMDEAAREQFIPYNPVRLCQESKAEGYKAAPLRLGQLQRYLNATEQLGVLPLIYTGLSSGLRQCELITLSWADFHVRYRYILKGQRLEENRAPSAMLAVTRLLHHMSRIFRDNSVPKSRPGGIQIDRKRLKKLQEKRMALGHKLDDHEEQWPDMTM